MKHIIKSKEPNVLYQYRTTTPNATYKGFQGTEEVRRSLLVEQGYICAYCMQRISADLNDKFKPKTEIEHFRSQDRHPKLSLDYKNMLGVCNGNSGMAKHKLICDKSKSKFDTSNDLTVDPLMLERINSLCYTAEGEIFSLNETIKDDIIRILNLNEEKLKEERKTIYRKIKKKIRSFWAVAKGRKTRVRELLENERNCWVSITSNGQFAPLCGVSLYLIDKELKKLSA